MIHCQFVLYNGHVKLTIYIDFNPFDCMLELLIWLHKWDIICSSVWLFIGTVNNLSLSIWMWSVMELQNSPIFKIFPLKICFLCEHFHLPSWIYIYLLFYCVVGLKICCVIGLISYWIGSWHDRIVFMNVLWNW